MSEPSRASRQWIHLSHSSKLWTQQISYSNIFWYKKVYIGMINNMMKVNIKIWFNFVVLFCNNLCLNDSVHQPYLDHTRDRNCNAFLSDFWYFVKIIWFHIKLDNHMHYKKRYNVLWEHNLKPTSPKAENTFHHFQLATGPCTSVKFNVNQWLYS